MEFTLPTTKQQMYNTLNEIFYYYRIQRQSFEPEQLNELELERLTFSSNTDADLKVIAANLVAPEQQREIDNRRQELQEDIDKLTYKIQAAQNSVEGQIEKVIEAYEKSKLAVEKQAIKNGLISSGILVDKFIELEEGKNQKITKINTDTQAEIDNLNAELNSKITARSNVENYFARAHEMDVTKKQIELKLERQRHYEETFKYNNGLDEKEQRYKNTIIQANINHQLKFLELSASEFSKDQLIEMGYYSDVVKCVCGYYDTLTPIVAFQEINSDQKVAIYLEDYYSNIVYMYQVKAGV